MCSGPSAYECGCAAGSAPHQGADDGWTTSDSHSWLGRGQTLAQQAQAMSVWSQGQVDDSCAAAEGRWGAWRCYLGQYAAPHIQATTLVLQSQIDEWQGFWNGFFNYTRDATAFEYATWFRATTSKQLQHSAVAGDDMREGSAGRLGLLPRAALTVHRCCEQTSSPRTATTTDWRTTRGSGSSRWRRARLPRGAAPRCLGRCSRASRPRTRSWTPAMASRAAPRRGPATRASAARSRRRRRPPEKRQASVFCASVVVAVAPICLRHSVQPNPTSRSGPSRVCPSGAAEPG